MALSNAVLLANIASGDALTVDSTNDRVGIGSTTPDVTLDVIGIISATNFSGDGSLLTNVGFDTSYISGIAATFTGNVTVGGVLTYEDVTNIDSVGIITAQSGINIVGGGLTVTGLSTFRNTVLLDADTKLNFYSSTSQEGQIYATNEYLYINSQADNGVFVQSNGFIELKRASGSDKYIEMNSHPNHNGEVSLYYNANKKLETTNTGVTVVGTVAATSFTGDGSSLTGISAGGITTEAQVKTTGQTALLTLSSAVDHKVTCTGTVTIDVTGGTLEGESHTLRIVNNGTATVGFSTHFLFPSGSVPSLPTADGTISLISFTIHRAASTGISTQLLSGSSVNYS